MLLKCCTAPASSHEECERSRACGFFLSIMVDSEVAQFRKNKNCLHRNQKRKVSYKQKAPHICGRGDLQLKDKQNASLLRQGYGTGVIPTEGQLQKGGAKKFMEPASSSEPSDVPFDFPDAPKTKVIVRHLPPSLAEKAFTESIPSHFGALINWISFSPGKTSDKSSTSRAYIDFKHPEDVFKFYEEFNEHLFVNEKGTRYRALVEYAPHQQVPKPFPEEDTQEGSISEDPEYLEFLDGLAKPIKLLPSAEVQLERKEAEKRSSLVAGAKETVVVTPLMEYVRHKRARSSQNVSMASRKKSASRGSSSLPNSILSSKRASNLSSSNIKCAATAVKPSVKLTYVPCRLHEANQCKEVFLDAKRKAVFEVREKVVMPENDIVQSSQKFGASRHSGSCKQIRKDRRLQHADVGKKSKQSSGSRSYEKQVWVAKSASGSSAKLCEGT